MDEGFALMKRKSELIEYLSPKDAIEAIVQSDGIAVLAHGILGDGGSNFGEDEITARVERLKDFGLGGLECFYSTYTDEQRRIMLSLADRYGMYVTAGSDYHGNNKKILLGDTGLKDAEYIKPFIKAVMKEQ